MIATRTMLHLVLVLYHQREKVVTGRVRQQNGANGQSAAGLVTMECKSLKPYFIY